MNTLIAIKSKRAIRKYTDKPLSQEEVETILNAGRLAQSAKNTQPWQFIAIQDKDILLPLSEHGLHTKHIEEAALAVAILTPPPSDRFSILFDAGQSAAYMQLAAWDIGVGSCLGTIYEPEKARSLLKFPAEWHLHIVISFGYPQPETDTPRPPRKTGRKNISEVVHWNEWSEAS